MFKFFYNREDPINRFTIILALVCLITTLVGSLLLSSSAKSLVPKLLKNLPTKMKLIVIEPDNCSDCFDITQVTDFIKDISKIKYSPVKKYKASDSNAGLLMKTYNIKVLPTFILQGDVKKLGIDRIFGKENIGKLEDKLFVYNNYFPPYYDVDKKEIKGRFGMVYLTDGSCTDCYDVYLHDKALKNLIMAPSASSTIDVSSDAGKEYIKKYSIQYAPTVLLNGDLDTYQNFKKLWETVGSIESDGRYVFREKGLDLMGKYKNLQTGKIIDRTSQ